MRISAKGRYAIASMIYMGQQREVQGNITLLSISKYLGISKIYLEQVFAALKKNDLVLSIKGAQGGYQLNKEPNEISIYDILSAVELTLFDKTESTDLKNSKEIDKVMHQFVFDPLDTVVQKHLKEVTLEGLINEANKHKEDDALMYYI